MTLNDITSCMQAYKNIITNGSTLVSYYKQGYYFDYTKPTDIVNSTHIHAYAGITPQKKLVFFLIPSEYDVQGTQHVETHVAQCNIISVVTGGTILPDAVAQAMCDRWKDNYTTWIPSQVAGAPIGMFLAFAIPVEDFVASTVRVHLALKLDSTAVTGMVADVVVANQNGTAVYYYDFATTVPPLPSTLVNSYYLLSLV